MSKKNSRVTIFDLRLRSCRFPLWGHNARPPINEKYYCGKPAVEGSAYCAECKAKAIDPSRTAKVKFNAGYAN